MRPLHNTSIGRITRLSKGEKPVKTVFSLYFVHAFDKIPEKTVAA
jgi:hypothetical protein